MKKLAIITAAVVLVGFLWWRANRAESDDRPRVERFEVQRGTVTDVLREVGELTPRDPILLQAPFTGEIKWLLQDGTWVNQGERVFILDEETLVEQVSQLRADLVDKRQQLRIAELQAEHARIAEEQKVENARQDLQLAEIRHRILTTQPEGGDRLIELDQQVAPIETRLEHLQVELEPLEQAYRVSRDAYLEVLRKWQEASSKLLELRTKADLAGANGKKKKGGRGKGPPPEEATETPMTIEEAKTQVADLKEQLDAARAQRDQDKAPYEKAVAAIDTVDAEAQELYILIEIEKRGLPATRLRIDRDVAKLRLSEAQRLVENGKRALAAGAMSKARSEQLIADAEAAAGRLEILEYRLEIASRPAEEDEVAASEAALATARRAVENAEDIFEREMDILASDKAVLVAQVAEAEGKLERTGKGFPGAIEGNITMLEAELELLTEEDRETRTQITTELETLRQELAEAEKVPPYIVLAPTNGLARLRWQEDRLTDIGDRWEKGHTVAMIYPPGGMRVKAGINEVNFQRVQDGMSCKVRIPALDLDIPEGRVAHMSRIGRDRVERKDRWVDSQGSGIIEFTLSVDVGRDVEDFRQGMTVLLEIETERRENQLHLPAAAVQADQDGFYVTMDANTRSRKQIEGEFFGDNAFIVTNGLKEGDRVYRIYEGGPSS